MTEDWFVTCGQPRCHHHPLIGTGTWYLTHLAAVHCQLFLSH